MARQARKCSDCRQRAVVPETLAAYAEDMSHDGRTYRVTVQDFDVLKCQNCGAMVFNETANQRLSAALREAVVLLSPEQIRAGRTRIGLSQKAFANAIRIAESTLCRWETGAQIQQRCMDLFLRLVFDIPAVLAYLNLASPPKVVQAWDGTQQPIGAEAAP
jgi:DNA-binding transcriptional regulator YiaG